MHSPVYLKCAVKGIMGILTISLINYSVEHFSQLSCGQKLISQNLRDTYNLEEIYTVRHILVSVNFSLAAIICL